MFWFWCFLDTPQSGSHALMPSLATDYSAYKKHGILTNNVFQSWTFFSLKDLVNIKQQLKPKSTYSTVKVIDCTHCSNWFQCQCCFFFVLNPSVFGSDDPGSNRRVLDDTMILHRATAEDSGVYQCEASNSHGSVMANVNIMIMSEYLS